VRLAARVKAAARSQLGHTEKKQRTTLDGERAEGEDVVSTEAPTTYERGTGGGGIRGKQK
jgi:hypothetical protein